MTLQKIHKKLQDLLSALLGGLQFWTLDFCVSQFPHLKSRE